MPKNKASKARNEAAKDIARAVAPHAVSALQGLAKTTKKKAKKSGGFWNILAGAARTAAELAPVVAPMFLANHGPTQQRAAMLGASSATPAVAPSVGIAQPMSCTTACGTYAMKEIKGKDGRIRGVRIRGMDYLGEIGVSEITPAGTLLNTIDLNPYSSAWVGTQLQRFASLYERYRPLRLVGLVEPGCPSTSTGQLLSFMDTDPDDTWTHQGRTAMQIASATLGCDIGQVWQLNACEYVGDPKTPDYFADAFGGDTRLISPGKWRILSGTGINPLEIGSLFAIWEYEFTIPTIENNIESGYFAYLGVPSGATPAVPFGGDWEAALITGNIYASLVNTGPGGAATYVYGLPTGTYYWIIEVNCTGSPAIVVDVDGFNYTGQLIGTVDDPVNALAYGEISVLDPSHTVDDGYFSVTINPGTTMNTGSMYFVTYPAGASLHRKKTLQNYESTVDKLVEEQSALKALISQLRLQPVVSSKPAPRGRPLGTHNVQKAAAAASLTSSSLDSITHTLAGPKK